MIKLAISLLAITACAADGGPSGGGDDVVGNDAPPFYDGVSTLAGSGEPAFVDGNRAVARFNNPVNVAFGPDGKLYVADFDNSKLRVVDPETGDTNTLIDQPDFHRPFGLAFSTSGTLFVTTDCNSTSAQQGPMTGSVWKIENGVASVVAENIGRPRGIAVLPDGRIAISDYQHHVIQLVNASSGVVTPLAGTWDAAGMVEGAVAKFASPYGLAVLDGALVVADHENQRLRSITLAGMTTTLAGMGSAGFGDGAAATAKLSRPQGIAVVNGMVYFTDVGNYRVRRVRDGNVETVAGTGEGGFLDAHDPLGAQLFGLEGIAVSPDGSRAFIADGSRGDAVPYNRIRRIEID